VDGWTADFVDDRAVMHLLWNIQIVNEITVNIYVVEYKM